MKTCTKCGEEKPHTGQYFATNGQQGYLRPDCRACQQAAVAQWQRDNPERARAQCRLYYARNIEQQRQRNRDAQARRAAGG